MGDKDEYRYYPEDFDTDGNLPETKTETDPTPLVIIGCFGVGVGFLIASLFGDSIPVFGTDISLVGVATAIFAFGLVVGGGSYIRQGRVRLGCIHLTGALGWLLLVLGRSFSSSATLVVGSITLALGAVGLFVLTWHGKV
jgi:hypothetical protein